MALDWRTVKLIKDKYTIPLILKGIATAEDAKIALDHGVEWIYVSNHGGRQLDQGRGAMQVLPEIAAAVAGRAKIMVDGSFCRGTDIVKGIAAGADLVEHDAGLTDVVVATIPGAGPAIVFLPQVVISYGNGLLLPNAIAGAVSVRPQAAGTAAGMTGFTQMAIGAASTQIVSIALAGGHSAMPMAWMLVIVVVATGVAYGALVRR